MGNKKIKTVTLGLEIILSLLVVASSYCTDLYDTALLYDSSNLQNSDINFQTVVQYYGLKCKQIDLSSTTLTDSLLRDENGNYFKAVGINAVTLECENPTLLDSTELSILKHAVDSSGINFLISGLNNQTCMNDYSVNTTDYADTIIISKDNNSIELPVFVMVSSGNGKVFVDGFIQYYNTQNVNLYSQYVYNYHPIVPTMMFVRYACDDECWHNNHNYANLTIDDPYFIEPSGYLNYQGLINEMETHNFHTTIGYIPKYYCYPQDTSVINLFLNYPDRYSIVQHGNNHDGYEFICYTQEQLDTLIAHHSTWNGQTPRPISEQEADIVEGETRMGELKKTTGIPCGDLMIFPWGISLSPTLALLKAYNFNTTVNAQYQPYFFLEGDDNSNYDFNMRPANMNFGNFPVVSRNHPCSSYEPLVFNTQWWPFQLFVDKSLLLYSHNGQIFKQGIDGFNPAADIINGIPGNTEWKSLGDIMKKMYLEKTNDDGSISVQFYGNNIIFSNETDESHLYHFQKEEWLNVPILDVKVDGTPIGYTVIDSILQFDLTIFPHTDKEIYITYSSGDKDFAVNNSDINIDSLGNTISVNVHNYGNDGGPCPVQFFDGTPDRGQSIALTTIERIGPDSTEIVQIPIPDLSPGMNYIYVKLDPYNVILESDESNNEAFAAIGLPTYNIIDNFEYEDSPLNHGWVIAGGEGDVSTVYDSCLNSRVMQVTTEQGTGFRIDYPENHNLTISKQYLSAKIRDNDYFIFYVRVHSNNGEDYYLQYTPDDGEISTNGSYVYIHLGDCYQDDNWYNIERDLDADIFAGLGIHFEYVKYFCIRGDYYLDDLVLDSVLNSQNIFIPENNTQLWIFGNVGVTVQFTSNHAATNLNVTKYSSNPGIIGNLPANVENICSERYWSINSSAGNVGTYNITFDLAGISGIQNFNTLYILKRNNSSSFWYDVTDLGATLSYNDPNITVSGLTTFSDFVPAGGSDNTLPVELTSFIAVYTLNETGNDFITLKWTTASETDVNGFNIYRSEQNNLNTVGNHINASLILGAGNTSETQHYSFFDETANPYQKYYYWLESIDFGGISEYYGPVKYVPGDSDGDQEVDVYKYTKLFGAYPNPVFNNTTIKYQLKGSVIEQDATIIIYNVLGQLVKTIEGKKGKAEFNVYDLPTGIYLYQLKTSNYNEVKKMLIIK